MDHSSLAYRRRRRDCICASRNRRGRALAHLGAQPPRKRAGYGPGAKLLVRYLPYSRGRCELRPQIGGIAMRHCNRSGAARPAAWSRSPLHSRPAAAGRRSVFAQQLLVTQHPGKIRVTRTDSSKIVLTDPEIVGDTCTDGAPGPGRSCRLTREGVALGDVGHVCSGGRSCRNRHAHRGSSCGAHRSRAGHPDALASIDNPEGAAAGPPCESAAGGRDHPRSRRAPELLRAGGRNWGRRSFPPLVRTAKIELRAGSDRLAGGPLPAAAQGGGRPRGRARGLASGILCPRVSPRRAAGRRRPSCIPPWGLGSGPTVPHIVAPPEAARHECLARAAPALQHPPDEAFLVTPIPGDLLEDTVSRLRIAASCGSSSGPPPFSSTTSFWRDGLRGRQSIGDDRATPSGACPFPHPSARVARSA